MAVLSGKAGTLRLAGNVVAPITNWKLQLSSDNKAYAANDTAGAKKRVAGIQDSSGSFECKVADNANCPVQCGEAATAQFHVDGTSANFYEVPIIVDKISVDCDINEGEIIAYVIDFSGDGAATPHGILAKGA